MMRSLRTLPQLRKSWYMGFFQLPWLPERALSAGVGRRFLHAAGMDSASVARYRAEMVEGGALTYGLNWYRAMPLADARGLGGRVTVPTTHVWSDQDAALGRLGADLTASYVVGDYRLEVLEGVDHWIPDVAPQRLAEIVLERVRSI